MFTELSLAECTLVLCLCIVAAWAVLSGADDLFILLAWAIYGGRLEKAFPKPPAQIREKRTAILIPLWREAGVVRQMVEHNLSTLRYSRVELFLGVYPNDPETIAEVQQLEAVYANVHVTLCPHNGPTSKADCLNWIFQRLLLFEESTGWKAEALVTHDAEDIMHAEELRWISHYLDRFDMVQIPVLPWPTPPWDLVHGVYCDEFAEYQTKDIPARMLLGGFIPSNGVGTGYRREAIERLAETEGNRIFSPECLTEDYENGYMLHRLGFRQAFIPLARLGGTIVATREYFPRRLQAAIRQRTRWITGIVLQSWQKHGWSGGWGDRYWWWRDRKGIVGNPMSHFANLLSMAVAFYLTGSAGDAGMRLRGILFTHPVAASVTGMLLFLQAVSLGMRMGAVGHIYGWKFALGVPLRVPVANAINTLAAARAAVRFFAARWTGEPLVWLKTEHSYPSRATLLAVEPEPSARWAASADATFAR